MSTSRREFLKTSGAAAAVTFAWTGGTQAASRSANEKLQIACIGTANRALADIDGVKDEDIVALCDVDEVFMERTAKRFPDAAKYTDYREMIAALGDKVDAIVVGTSDHHHAPAAMRAILAGKHVYCEKPLTHTVQEARLLTNAAREAGVVTQMGTQIHATDNYRRVVEVVESGAIGDVTEVHVWVGKGWGGGERPAEGKQPPAHLNWDLWLGPAPERPFYPGKYHPAQWRRWWDFGGGTLADMACHYMDLPFWALKLKYPTSVKAEGPEVHPETCPLGLKVMYEFPARDTMPGLKLTWYDGNMIPKTVAGERVPGAGVMFVGSEGKLFANYSSYRLFPTDKFKGFQPPPKTLSDSIGHHKEWIKACKEGNKKAALCNFDYAGPLTETVLLGNVAFRTGKTLEWDAKTLKAANCPEADQYISKKNREGWEVAELVEKAAV
ncbi:MAG: Gfo/Idh/MocA family protein [Planctomycetaceae bacterium]